MAAGKLRIGINGFGRIGRALYRINQQQRRFDIVLINDLCPDPANLAYLLAYDTIYGRLPERVEACRGGLQVGARDVALSRCADIGQAPWRQHAVDVIIDASGVADNPARLRRAGWGGHAVITHAVADPQLAKTVLFGVNENDFVPARDRVVSASICDTVALAPLLAILERHFGIQGGFLTTLHPWLAQQRLQDGPAPPQAPADYALGRSAVNNLIPKTTSAVQAAECLFPGIAAKLAALSYRVPTNIVSSAVLQLQLARPGGRDEVVELLRRAAREQSWNVLANCEEPRVSLDYCGSPYSLTVDQRWTMVDAGGQLRLMYWYDNEWGYSSRVLDIVRKIAHAR